VGAGGRVRNCETVSSGESLADESIRPELELRSDGVSNRDSVRSVGILKEICLRRQLAAMHFWLASSHLIVGSSVGVSVVTVENRVPWGRRS
jgi:hypothetical protein